MPRHAGHWGYREGPKSKKFVPIVSGKCRTMRSNTKLDDNLDAFFKNKGYRPPRSPLWGVATHGLEEIPSKSIKKRHIEESGITKRKKHV